MFFYELHIKQPSLLSMEQTIWASFSSSISGSLASAGVAARAEREENIINIMGEWNLFLLL